MKGYVAERRKPSGGFTAPNSCGGTCQNSLHQRMLWDLWRDPLKRCHGIAGTTSFLMDRIATELLAELLLLHQFAAFGVQRVVPEHQASVAASTAAAWVAGAK